MKYYIIAGEASGDLHGSNLIKQLKLLDHQAQFRCWGGDKMLAQGITLVKHIKDLAFMGFLEVVKNLPTILNNISFCKKDILENRPDAIILIDYPGFNLRIASFAKQHHIKVIYYISPQVWAWKQSRVKKIKATVDAMLVILPFEQAFYKQHHYDVFYTGHPLLDAIEDIKDNSNTLNEFLQINLLPNRPIIALLPGSRKQEIAAMLPIMLQVKSAFKDYQFIVACAPSIPSAFYKDIVGDLDVKFVYDQTYQLLQHAKAALVTSGTATLETALFNVPEVVCYKGSKISYHIARKLIKVKYISLVNLIMDEEIVKELIQDDLNVTQLNKELSKLLSQENQHQLKSSYETLRNKLGGKGASARAAKHILEFLHKN
jgi:lipid-A-disaccharide synthase